MTVCPAVLGIDRLRCMNREPSRRPVFAVSRTAKVEVGSCSVVVSLDEETQPQLKCCKED